MTYCMPLHDTEVFIFDSSVEAINCCWLEVTTIIDRVHGAREIPVRPVPPCVSVH